jgi:NAD dependent epimerase/dehydratase family enzyme
VLGTVLHRPALFRVPAPVLRLALGEMADELLLSSQRVRPEALGRNGFEFQYPTIESALKQLLISGGGILNLISI